MDDKYWVFIVGSRTGTLYIGMTNSIERRMWEHKSGEFEGFASKYHCDHLLYYESFDEVVQAINREKQWKGWVRRNKDRSYRKGESSLARLSREMGSTDANARSVAKRPVRIPREIGARSQRHGVLRLGLTPSLRMTGLGFRQFR